MPSNGSTLTAAAWFGNEASLFATQAYERRLGAQASLLRYGDPESSLTVTAVHAVMHWSWSGAVKLADRGTGSLAELLGANGVARGFLIARRPQAPQEMLDLVSQAAEMSAAEGNLVVDLHGMRDQRDIDAEVGLGINPTPRELLAADALSGELRSRGLTVAINEVFQAPQPSNVTNKVRLQGGISIQLEIAARARPPAGEHVRAQAILDSLKALSQGRQWLA